MRKKTPNARARILDAAVKVFAQKGFEGSRIDGIAARAGVPKSLIYYHFKGKDEIFAVLVEGFVHDYLEIARLAEKDTHETKLDSVRTRSARYEAFFRDHYDLIRIMFIDSLKKENKKPVLFRIVESMIEIEKNFAIGPDMPAYDAHERRVTEFFTNLIPTYAFICFMESWAKYFKIGETRLKLLFGEALMKTHGAYHASHGKRGGGKATSPRTKTQGEKT